MSRSEAYGYAVARIRAMEPLLLDAGTLQRMLDADDLGGALKILGETTYARGFSGSGSDERYDTVLEAELYQTYDDLRNFVPDIELINIFRIPYDFHNIKVLIKSSFNARSGGKKRWDLLTSLGTLSTDDITVRFESEEFHMLPWGLSQVIPLCFTQWEQTKDIVEVERLLDDAFFTALFKEAEKLEEPGVLAWIKARIDAENIRNLLRLKRFGFDASRAVTFMHSCGSLSPEVLVQLIPEPFEGWGRVLSFSDIGGAIASIQDDGNFDNLIVNVERTLDDFCQSVVAKAKYSAAAPENVLAYLWGKEMEVKNIRTILVSKSMGSDKDEVRRLLRHGY